MRKVLTAIFLLSAPAAAEQFALQIGNPVAVQTTHAKMASFVFRAVGCADLSKVEISATAEGLVAGERKSQKLSKVSPGPTPGVYMVFREWPVDGVWVLHLTARCVTESAGAIVAVGSKGVMRESSKFFSRPATESEIKSSLQSLAQGGNR